MGLVVDGSMDLGAYIWHPPQIFFAGGMTSQREKAWDRDSLVTSNTLANLQLLVIINNILTCIFCLHLKSKLAAILDDKDKLWFY